MSNLQKYPLQLHGLGFNTHLRSISWGRLRVQPMFLLKYSCLVNRHEMEWKVASIEG